MTNPQQIFDTVRPWLTPPGFSAKGRIDALDDACDLLLSSPNNSPVFEAVRPWLDGEGFTPRRIAALDAACEAFRKTSDGDWWGKIEPAPAAPVGDDRYLRLFQHLAAPNANPETVKAMARSFAAHAPAYGQDTSKARIAEFVAQIANETGGFRVFVENLNYRASVLLRQWPSHFTPAQAAAAVGNPVEIASRAYGGRMGNAPYPSDEGFKFRGQGALQLTGKANFKRFGDLLGIDLIAHPELAADPAVSVQIALEFFKQGGVNEPIDRGDFREARRRTNGGAIGLEHVAQLRAKALEVL